MPRLDNFDRARPRRAGQRGFTMTEMMLVSAITFIIAAFSIEVYIQIARNMKTSGDGRDLGSEVALAKMRGPAYFTQARVYADLSAQSFHVEVWLKSSSQWSTEGGIQHLSQGVTFGYGSLSSPPSGTQASLAQAPACLNSGGGAIANTACIVFNSRGIPIDSTGTPTNNDAFYITDGQQTYGVTVSATGLIQSWQTVASTANWRKR